MRRGRLSARFPLSCCPIYTRQLADTATDFSSCDAQFAVCRDFALGSGQREELWIGERFDDEGHSGATLDRPALNELRKLIRRGRITHLYAVALAPRRV